MEFILEASDETLSTHSGLGLIGLLSSKTNVYERLSHIHLPIIKTLPFISNGDIIHSYLGLLCQSKYDFDHINPFLTISIPSGMIHFSIVHLILK